MNNLSFIFSNKNIDNNQKKEIVKQIKSFLSKSKDLSDENIEEFCRNRNFSFYIIGNEVIVSVVK